MCEMVDQSTSRSARVARAEAIKTKKYRENGKKWNEGQTEEPYMVEKLQRTMGNIQSNYQLRSQVVVEESPKNMQEEYPLLHFIPSLQSDRIPVF